MTYFDRAAHEATVGRQMQKRKEEIERKELVFKHLESGGSMCPRCSALYGPNDHVFSCRNCHASFAGELKLAEERN